MNYRPHCPPSPPSPPSPSSSKVTRASASGPSIPPEASSARATASVLHPLDLGLYRANVQSLSDAKKFELLTKAWQPDKTFKFPAVEMFKKQRSFRYEWLQTYPWLVYSAHRDGALCNYCVLFSSISGKNSERLEKLYTEPITNWVSATSKFKDHELRSEFHRSATVTAMDFQRVMEGSVPPVHHQLVTSKQRQLEQNTEKLKSIMKTVILCERQNLALCGHRDDATNTTGSNPGNF